MEFTGHLEEKGWRAHGDWKLRKFVLKGKFLRCYINDQERNAYIIDAESFVTTIQPGSVENGSKSIADEGHKHVFSVCTKGLPPTYTKKKIVLAAPDRNALNAWIRVLGECAFEGVTVNIQEIWPDNFRHQYSLFNISYNGRTVSDGNSFSAVQLELAPFNISLDTKFGAKSNPKLLRHLWSYSNAASSVGASRLIPSIKALTAGLGPADVTAASSSNTGLKLFYSLILVAAETMPGVEPRWVSGKEYGMMELI